MVTKHIPAPASRGLSRRAVLGALLASAASSSMVVVTGCSAYPAEDGEAFAPWQYPSENESLENALVHAGLLAASPHNTQPWAFVVTSGQIDLYAATDRSLGAMDPLHREMHIGLGCAVENMVLAAHSQGFVATVEWLPSPAEPTHVARLTLSSSSATDPQADALHAAIPFRHTNRYAYLDGGTPPGLVTSLETLVDDEVVSLTFLSDPSKRNAFKQGTIDATRTINDDLAMSEASHAWWRQTHDDIEAHRDGLTVDASGLGSTTRFLGKSVSAPDAKSAGEYWLDATKSTQTTGFGFGILSSVTRNDRAQQLRVGRIWQRIHLWATSQGLNVQPLNQMAERQDREEQLGLQPRFSSLLASLTSRSASTAQMLFRIGVAWDNAFKSPRRPVGWVLR